jgi:biopolymer transport protein ExbB
MENPNKNNALGRILLAYKALSTLDIETLELKMGESILKEVPRINKHLPLLKIIAGVAPLLGLLGTVTGMIITFQAITLFGAGDPRLMAGGISQALITTVLGLSVAIPILLLHNIVQSKARMLADMLQHEAVALVASQAEKAQQP